MAKLDMARKGKNYICRGNTRRELQLAQRRSRYQEAATSCYGNETPEEREVRLELQRSRYRARKEAETPEAKELRLEQRRSRYREARLAETETEREARLAQRKTYKRDSS